jgi:hypothetical protein
LLTLPAGDTELIENYEDNLFSGKDLNFSYSFETGGFYKLTVVWSKEYGTYVMGIFKGEDKKIFYKKDDLIAEVPFR